jgi:hypothetical protein
MFGSRGSKSAAVFVAALVIALPFQLYEWFKIEAVLDQSMWAPAIVTTLHDGFLRPHPEIFGYPYGYPGSTLLYPGACLVHFGVPPVTALRLVMAVFISLGIALSSWVMYRLRSKSLWWVGGFGILLFDALYFDATPPSGMVMPLIVAIVLLTLYGQEERGRPEPFVLLGAAGGIALATRTDISLAVLGMSFFFLLFTARRYLWVFALTSVLTFVAANPYIWGRPEEYFTATVHRILSSYLTLRYSLPFWSVVEGAPLGVVSMGFGLLTALFTPKLFPFCRAFVGWWAVSFATICAVLLHSSFHPSWYFYPLFMVWEALLPALILAPLAAVTLPSGVPWLTRRHLELLMVALLILAQLGLFIGVNRPL